MRDAYNMVKGDANRLSYEAAHCLKRAHRFRRTTSDAIGSTRIVLILPRSCRTSL